MLLLKEESSSPDSSSLKNRNQSRYKQKKTLFFFVQLATIFCHVYETILRKTLSRSLRIVYSKQKVSKAQSPGGHKSKTYGSIVAMQTEQIYNSTQQYTRFNTFFLILGYASSISSQIYLFSPLFPSIIQMVLFMTIATKHTSGHPALKYIFSWQLWGHKNIKRKIEKKNRRKKRQVGYTYAFV